MPRQDQTDFSLADPLGCDMSCGTDMDPAGRLESGTSLLAQDIFWRWNCPRGRLIDDPDYGIDIRRELISQAMTRAKLLAFPRRLEAEARKDERVQSIAVTLSQTDTYAFRIEARGTTVNGATFRLVADVTQAYSRIVETA